MIISSQRYINDEIVLAKIEEQDFEVLVSPSFMVDGMALRVVLDGHHSLAAARQTGVEPVLVIADATDHDAVSLLERGEVEDFLAVTHMGDDYYDVETGKDIW